MSKDDVYFYIKVESYLPRNTSGLHGKIHIRACKGETLPQDLHVECSKDLSTKFPVGTQFKIKAKLTDREGMGKFIYSSYRWPFEVINE